LNRPVRDGKKVLEGDLQGNPGVRNRRCRGKWQEGAIRKMTGLMSGVFKKECSKKKQKRDTRPSATSTGLDHGHEKNSNFGTGRTRPDGIVGGVEGAAVAYHKSQEGETTNTLCLDLRRERPVSGGCHHWHYEQSRGPGGQGGSRNCAGWKKKKKPADLSQKKR